MIRRFGLCLIREEDLMKSRVDYARLQADLRAANGTVAQRDGALDYAHKQIAELQAENARLLQAVAAHETTIAALSTTGEQTAQER